jgi:glycosyltransferase involved in cell wall biosynthesis
MASLDGISAVICTRNRCASLALCLAGFERQTLSSSRFEVIVVDNGSSDGTSDLMASFCARHRHFHYHLEERVGLSIARNTGVRLSSADIVAFTDDDAVPEPNWLEQLLGCFRRWPDSLGIAGGDVIPIWETERPEWLSDSLLRPLSAGLKWSAEPRLLRAGEWLVEVNSAYRKQALLAFDGFPEHLGRVGDSLLSGEGGIYMLFERAGFGMYYDPAILVRHHIPANRASKAWFRRRSFWQGVSLNLLNRYVEDMTRKHGMPDPTRHMRAWEEIGVPLSPAAWAELFDDHVPESFETQLVRLEQLGYLLESQSVVIGR